MREARYMVPSDTVVEKKIKPALIAAGAARKGWYGLTDVIYGPSDYNDRFVRLRVARNTRIPGLSVVLTHKATTWGLYSKTDTILPHQKPFEDVTSADAYIERAYSGVMQKQFAFSRDGMEYTLGDLRIFVEDILVPGIRWSVEIEGPGDAAIAACATLLGLGEPICDSVPTLVYKRLQSVKGDKL